MDEGKKKEKKKEKKHRCSKKLEKPELKVTTRGEGADTPVWTHAGPTKDSSSSSDSQSDGDSGLGSQSFHPALSRYRHRIPARCCSLIKSGCYQGAHRGQPTQ